MKTLKVHPQLCVLTAEAVCVVLGYKPSWNEYLKAINNSGQFITNLTSLPTVMSEATMNKLEPYISNPQFTKENIQKCSTTFAVMCDFVRHLYDYNVVNQRFAKMKKQVAQLMQPSDLDMEKARQIKTRELESHLRHAQKCVNELNVDAVKTYASKSNINPDDLIKIVSEAVCVMLDKKPDFQEFKKISAKADAFLKTLKEFDTTMMSPAKVAKIKPYFDNPWFDEQKAVQVSMTTSRYIGWITACYNYAVGVKEVMVLVLVFGAVCVKLNGVFGC